MQLVLRTKTIMRYCRCHISSQSAQGFKQNFRHKNMAEGFEIDVWFSPVTISPANTDCSPIITLLIIMIFTVKDCKNAKVKTC